MLTWKNVEVSKDSVLYIYIDRLMEIPNCWDKAFQLFPIIFSLFSG